MKMLKRLALFPLVLPLALVLCTGCDSNGEDEPERTGSLSGVVREADAQTPLPNVNVALESAQTTTDQDGRYAFHDFAVGQSMKLRVVATGFDEFEENLLVQESDNIRDILLVRKTLYSYDTAQGLFRMYLPPSAATYRSVLFFVAPATVEARGFVNGAALTVANPPSAEALVRLNEQATGLREWALEHAAEKYGMALLGANLNIPSSAQTRADVLEALTQIAEQSGHPELSHAPLVLVGMSMGGCFAYDFTRNYGSRVVGFIAQKGGCCGVLRVDLDRGFQLVIDLIRLDDPRLGINAAEDADDEAGSGKRPVQLFHQGKLGVGEAVPDGLCGAASDQARKEAGQPSARSRGRLALPSTPPRRRDLGGR
jgi:dienelactone hydrolase